MTGAKNVKNYETSNLAKPVRPVASGPVNPATHLKAKEAHLGRRRVPRRSFDGATGVLLHGEYLLERAYQVGEGGMMIGSARKLSVGDMVVVSFYLPNSNTIVVRGVVRAVVPATDQLPERYGLEFAKLNFQYKREIRNYVASAI